MKTIKAKVHMLPTDDYTSIVVSNKGELEYTYGEQVNGYQKHLYITTDEEIKEEYPQIVLEQMVDGTWDLIQIDNIHDIDRKNQRKIVASTDSKLHTNEIVEEDMHMYKKSLPQIPKSFIEEYCEAGGIDEVLVEYHPKGCSYGNIILDDLNGDGSYYGDNNKYEVEISRSRKEVESYGAKFHDSLLKLDNNCIIIHPVEEKMYSRDEILHKLTIKSLREKFHSQSGMFINKQTSYEIIKWIEENL